MNCTAGLLLVLLSSPVTFAQQPATDLVYTATPRETTIDRHGHVIVDLRLKNAGREPKVVYWGAAAAAEMYRFDIRHIASGVRVPTSSEFFQVDGAAPVAGDAVHFCELPAGETLTYAITLGAVYGNHMQTAWFDRSGEYELSPTLKVTTSRVLDAAAGRVATHPVAWTGRLVAKPFRVTVREPDSDQKAKEVVGRLLTHHGQPASGVSVELKHLVVAPSALNGFVHRSAGRVFTDDHGRFRFRMVPDSATSYLFRIRDARYVFQNFDISSDSALLLLLAKPTIVRGRVLNEEGVPMPGVRVSSRAYTDSDGRFQLIEPADSSEYSVRVARPGHASAAVIAGAQVATGGDWNIVMYREGRLRVNAVAKFADGEPVAHSRLQFELRSANGRVYPESLHAETDESGRFEISLPDRGVATAHVTARRRRQNAGSIMWRTTIERFDEAQPLELTFENRGRIAVRVVEEELLPSNHQLTVRCVDVASRRVFAEKTLREDKAGLLFTELMPGEYDIEVRANTLVDGNWKQRVRVPGESPFQARAVVTVPDLELGSVVATLVRPDGQTPASHVRLRASSYGPVQTVVADADGRVVIPAMPPGPLWLSPEPEQEVATTAFPNLHVHPGRTTDLGRLQLASVKDAFGTLEATLRDRQGKAVPNAALMGMFAGVDGGIGVPEWFRPQRIERGQVKARLQAGRNRMVISLDTRDGDMLHFGSPAGQRLIVDATIVGGETARQKLTVPLPFDRQLTARWRSPKEKAATAQISAIVPMGTMWWLDQSDGIGKSFGTEQHVLTTREPRESFTFPRMPQGPCYLLYRELTGACFIPKRVEADARTVRFDPDATGALKVLLAADNTGMLPALELEWCESGLEIPVCVLHPMARWRRERVLQHPMFSPVDGGVEIGRLGAGRYRLTVSGPDWTVRRTITVESGRQTHERVERQPPK